MSEQYNLYSIILDFILKVLIVLVISAIIIRYRKEIARFLANNVSRFKTKVLGQEFELTIKNLKESQSQAVNENNQEEIVKDKDKLINKLQSELEFEKIYSIIFGSQIEILKLLTKGEMELSTFSVEFNYTSYKYKVYEDWSEEEFLRILIKNQLVVNNELNLQITTKGLDFLNYIQENNYNDRLF